MAKSYGVNSNFKVRYLLAALIILGLSFFSIGCNTLDTPNGSNNNIIQSDNIEELLARKGVAECTSCHLMKPEVYTWAISSHSRIACVTCHADININDKLQTFTDASFTTPIKLQSFIQDDVCNQCHSVNRKVTPSGDVIIPHQFHSEMGMACTLCHKSMVHNRMSERLPKLDQKFQDYESWNLELAEEAYHVRFNLPSMDTCLDCHKKVTKVTKCAACHLRIPSLPSHDDPAWQTSHGKPGPETLERCIYCHQMPIPDPAPNPSTGFPIADFARQSEFCYNCHLKNSHTGNWRPIHPETARNKGMQNCAACHDYKEPINKSKATTTYCSKCHW